MTAARTCSQSSCKRQALDRAEQRFWGPAIKPQRRHLLHQGNPLGGEGSGDSRKDMLAELMQKASARQNRSAVQEVQNTATAPKSHTSDNLGRPSPLRKAKTLGGGLNGDSHSNMLAELLQKTSAMQSRASIH